MVRAEHLQQLWKEKYDEWLKRPKSKFSFAERDRLAQPANPLEVQGRRVTEKATKRPGLVGFYYRVAQLSIIR